MARAKYLLYYEQLWNQHGSELKSFQEVHDKFRDDPSQYEEQFHQDGTQILDLFRAVERRLCAGMERGGYGSYSGTLAEKFWQTVKKDFPLIEKVGVRIRKVSV